MKSTIKSHVATLLALVLSMGMAVTAYAANTSIINDSQEIPYLSGYDIKSITFTLGADNSLTAEIVPYGVPGDTDGDGDANASSNPMIDDDPGVGISEMLEIDMECGATEASIAANGGGCIPNVILIFTDNTLSVYNLLTAADLLSDPNFTITFGIVGDHYEMKISDLLAFKTALGISTTTVNFGAFHIVASFADNQEDDQIPDNFGCAAVHLDPPVVATCNLLLQKTANVSTVGPILVPVSNEPNHDDSDDSHQDANNNGDSDDSDTDNTNLTCGCSGKVSSLTLRYTGTTPTTVTVDRLNPFGVNLLPSTAILPGDIFTVNGSEFGPKGFRGTLGTSIRITESDGDVADLHTSCSEPIGPGTVAGDFVVESGQSKRLSVPLCPTAPPSCPANQKVTYTYSVTNNGTDITGLVVTDDKMLAPVGGPVTLAANTTTSFTADACLYETTTNIASATGTLSNAQACASNTSTVTVVMLEPQPPTDECNGSIDSDSDSAFDTNHNGDSDDSDADSGSADCDGDSDAMPTAPPVYHGCGPDYWGEHKKHKSAWGSHKPDDRFDATFGVDAAGNKGLLKVLNEKDRSGKGGASKDMQRHAAAALLNASNPDMHYFYNPGEVVAIVVDAYNTKNFDGAKNLLKMQNDAGCPLQD